MNLRKLFIVSVLALLTIFAVACSNDGDKNNANNDDTNAGADTSWKDKDPEDIEGDITVITQRTDIVDTVFQDYAKEFQEICPNVTVEFEALTDYGGEIMPRMNTEEYGDVLLIPVQIPIENIPDYFEPLGTLADMEEEYRGVEERAVDSTVYGIPIAVTYTGVIYNKAVFEEAGIDELP